MFAISGRIKNKNLPNDIYNASIRHIEESIKHSTRLYFKENEFYQVLPPRIRSKLVHNVLHQEIKRIKYFFQDIHNDKTTTEFPQDFINQIVTSLDSKIYFPG